MALDLKSCCLAVAPEQSFVVCDVGANPLDERAVYAPLLEDGVAHVYGFEPQPAALERLNATKSERETYSPEAVGDGKDGQLHIYRSQGFTSCFPVNPGTAQLFMRFAKKTQLISKVDIKCTRLDDMGDVPYIDFLKIDVQGSEFDVISNGRAKLSSAVAIQTELRFFPLYDGEATMGDLHNELAGQGFQLHNFVHLTHHRLDARRATTGRRGMATQLIDGDALYLRDLRTIGDWSVHQVKMLANLALRVHPSYDLATFAMAELERRDELDGGIIDLLLESRPF